MNKNFLKDNGDARSGFERRQFSYDKHIPERRSGNDRRNGFDKRLKHNISEYKDLEIKLQKMFEINKKSHSIKKQCQAKSDINHVIRRRKGEPDKLISLAPKKI
jgi:hypothetical protein